MALSLLLKTDIHAYLLPIDLLFKKLLFRSATRLASLPPSHPLFTFVRKAAIRYVKKHRSMLHSLFHSSDITPDNIEPVSPARRRPSYRPKFSTHILGDKEDALVAARTLHDSKVSIYCDGSGFEGKIGAAAVLYIDQVETKTLKYHLAPITDHTVYEGELVGLSLTFHLLNSLRLPVRSRIVIGSDSQAVIKPLKNQKSHPA